METWIPLISEYGFPVMITLYLLNRIEKKLDLLNGTMQQLVNHITRPKMTKDAPKQLMNNA